MVLFAIIDALVSFPGSPHSRKNIASGGRLETRLSCRAGSCIIHIYRVCMVCSMLLETCNGPSAHCMKAIEGSFGCDPHWGDP